MNPTWHTEHSIWKAQQIIKIIKKNKINPRSICDIGCGTGEVLRQLQLFLNKGCTFVGYEISPQAFHLCQKRTNNHLQFKLKDIRQERKTFFDLILMIDLIEHLEDYFTFLREIKDRGEYKLLHIPLDYSAQAIIRLSPLIKCRKSVGHLHYFFKEMIFQILKEVDYKIIDYFYTPSSQELPSKSLITSFAIFPRKLLFSINKDLAVRVLGGYSLLVLTK